MPGASDGISAVAGLRVGHATDLEHRTGCTVVLCPPAGCVAAVDVRGSAPGTRETDLLRPGSLVPRVNAILLTGGSAFGLAAADGVMRYLEERQMGFATGVAVVPIVPAAVIFDLAVGDAHVRPGAAMGYAACQAAGTGPMTEGAAGAGTGATVGKVLGPQAAAPGGVGAVALHLPGGLIVAALMVVNTFGDVVDPRSGRIVAGARLPSGRWADTARLLAQGVNEAPWAGNTIIGVVASNARLSREQCGKVAQMANDGLARVVRPAHTMFDGDAIFALATGDLENDSSDAEVTRIGHAAADATAQAILRGVRPLAAWREQHA